MLVMFSARQLKVGAWEQFRRAWDAGETKPPGFRRAYHARNIRDEDEVISFGLFDMTDRPGWQRRWSAAERGLFVQPGELVRVADRVDAGDPAPLDGQADRGVELA